ncbi:UDP-N-acetylglucosamine diphosphorylase/glucosamine-1-phosphate N-acetyltransferase [Halomonas sp. SF2003]|nr:UDP-N-acetylglucosamine diphosphorylase/glucosamine-1-phosphate N-acetyltransferase [Halomonas sp. SF2003]
MSSAERTDVVILAAGQGTRMRSKLPKVLHPLAGKAMVRHVADTAAGLDGAHLNVVIGHGGERVQQQLADTGASFAVQAEQKGTGHAVAQSLDAIGDGKVLILYGDVPLIRRETLEALLAEVSEQTLGLLTVILEDPTGYGRIVRDAEGRVSAIVEHKDATPEQLAIQEGNTGILATTGAQLKRWLPALSADNAQGEYYLTDIIAMAASEGVNIATAQPAAVEEVQGVNNRLQLADLERAFQRREANRLMTEGASLADPSRIDVRGKLTIGTDISIDVGCIFEGEVTLADDVVIGAHCVIRNATIGAGANIAPYSVIDGAVLEGDNNVGPFARLRPGTELARGARIGNFVETKNAQVGVDAKINHLSYVGDATLGEAVNVGAGTITCNYDGANKFRTEIGANAFIGSNSALVAPLKIGAGATVGAGSTLSRDVAEGALSVARGKRIDKPEWPRPTKK